MNSNNNQNYCPNTPLHQSYYSQATCCNIGAYTTEEAHTDQESTTERYKPFISSLLKDALIYGKETAKQNYYPHSHVNADMIPSHRSTLVNQIVSHNPYQTSAVENTTSEMQSMQFFGNLQCQYQQQEYNDYSQNYPQHTVQLQNDAIFIPGPSTISTQYEQAKPKQQTISNVQESQMDSWYKFNNNNIGQRNKNIETSNSDNRQRGSNNADYAWLYKKTNG